MPHSLGSGAFIIENIVVVAVFIICHYNLSNSNIPSKLGNKKYSLYFEGCVK